ncbi:MAG TPA: flagellar basal-body rod protein FlgF [Bacillales bacterium]|nr:flagellar basal-body rod protein FlgF [Bacillales bacterium]
MLRSMYSGISGMKNFQTKLDVIGNNIANVNTFGYKKGRVTFKDLVSQQMAGASNPSASQGGTNPEQVGLGSSIGSVDTVHTQGSLQTTGRPLDLAISGDGFFIVNKGAQNFYTRAGNFYVDQSGMLVNSEGMRVLGYGVDTNGLVDKTGGLKQLHISNNAIQQPLTDSLTVVGNLDLSKFIDPATGTPVGGASKSLDFKMFDTTGTEHQATINFDTPTASTAPNSSGQYYVQNLDFTITSEGTTQTGTVTLNDDGTVNNVALTGDPATFTFTNGQTVSIPGQNLSFAGLTMYNTSGSADVVGDVAKLSGYQIGSSGEISAILSNGDVQLLGQIALAGFDNPGGLEKSGGNLYSPTNNSGIPQVGAPGDGLGDLQAGMLEMSNVDLATAFTEMIVAERGFEANTKIITTSDQILQDLVNLKR